MQTTKYTKVRRAVLGLILVAVIIEFGRTTFGTFCIVEGESMCPTLNAGDFIQARASYVKMRGDVVILTDDSGSKAIKRIVGLPGEVVTLYGGEVYVNGWRLFEPYVAEAACTFKNNQKNEPAAVWHLTEDEYFVMGDNRCGSGDSRHYGPIRRSEIHGVVTLPKNAPGPAFLEVMLSESGNVIQNKHDRPISGPNHVLAARRTARSQPRTVPEAGVH
jgi:signal peptidase I